MLEWIEALQWERQYHDTEIFWMFSLIYVIKYWDVCLEIQITTHTPVACVECVHLNLNFEFSELFWL